jgi:hypothetical protein
MRRQPFQADVLARLDRIEKLVTPDPAPCWRCRDWAEEVIGLDGTVTQAQEWTDFGGMCPVCHRRPRVIPDDKRRF